MKNNVVSFGEAVQRRAEAFKKSAANSAQPAGNIIQFAHDNPQDGKLDIKEGIHEIEHEVRNTAGHSINEFDNL